MSLGAAEIAILFIIFCFFFSDLHTYKSEIKHFWYSFLYDLKWLRASNKQSKKKKIKIREGKQFFRVLLKDQYLKIFVIARNSLDIYASNYITFTYCELTKIFCKIVDLK